MESGCCKDHQPEAFILFKCFVMRESFLFFSLNFYEKSKHLSLPVTCHLGQGLYKNNVGPTQHFYSHLAKTFVAVFYFWKCNQSFKIIVCLYTIMAHRLSTYVLCLQQIDL